jgi:hypothetical protein
MNKAQFKKWSTVVKETAEKLGLHDYQMFVDYKEIECEGNEDVIGATVADIDNRCANVVLNKEYEGELSDSRIVLNAKHEALELLFMQVRFMLEEYYSEKIADREIHKLIRVFEKLV